MTGRKGVVVQAQAKVNLRLRIHAREESGFHQVETLFLRLALSDTVTVRPAATDSLDVHGDVDLAAIGAAEENLAWRAMQAFRNASGDSQRYAVAIEKRIPIGGGLGGGSADAAAVLRALNALSVTPLPTVRLLTLAAELGSDVPFLASEAAYALAWGRGERMLALEPPSERSVLLAIPPFGVNTGDAYRWLAESRANVKRANEPVLLDSTSLTDWASISQISVNDFETAVTAHYPALGALISALEVSEDVELARMSGSGSTVFAIAHAGKTVMRIRPAETFDVNVREVSTHTAVRVEPVLQTE